MAFADATSALGCWRQEHPRATFNEIEEARDRFMQPVLTGMTVHLAEQGGAEAARIRCPQCEGLLQKAGRQTRELLGEDGQRTRLERDYKRCKACGWAGFPPR